MRDLLYFLLAILLVSVSACGHKGKENSVVLEASEIDTTLKKTTIKFVATEHDFGQVKEGAKVVHTYEVINTGDADLLLQSVRPTCGCTVPKYDRKPIRPGKKGSIEIVFNTRGRPGKQHKSVIVVTNTEPPNTSLSFTCEVMPVEK
ncbi:MAG: DUF1573 domain-containing protein [Bacteroidales bacterium]|jgi:hypothetical protein|nr:DUF1573 domain-containing protein [Bacteroidales bacterium]